MRKRKLLGPRTKIYKCADCKTIVTSNDRTCPRCKGSDLRPAKEDWEDVEQEQPTLEDKTLD